MKLKLIIFALILGSYFLYVQHAAAALNNSLSHVKNLYAQGIAAAANIQNSQTGQ